MKNKNQQLKPLRISGETVRNLSTAQLAAINAGGSTFTTYQPTFCLACQR